MTNLEYADSARCCRFRSSQQKRASDLDSTHVLIPKLDVASSSPSPGPFLFNSLRMILPRLTPNSPRYLSEGEGAIRNLLI
jgi:hypothetical protein